MGIETRSMMGRSLLGAAVLAAVSAANVASYAPPSDFGYAYPRKWSPRVKGRADSLRDRPPKKLHSKLYAAYRKGKRGGRATRWDSMNVARAIAAGRRDAR